MGRPRLRPVAPHRSPPARDRGPLRGVGAPGGRSVPALRGRRLLSAPQGEVEMAPRPTEVTVDTWTGRMNEWNECADTGLPYGSAAEARRCWRCTRSLGRCAHRLS